MRTTVDIDETLLAKAMRARGLKTKKAAVDAGLRLIVQLKAQEKALRLAGKVR
jgi:Arc/MetJ family transcription regulator